MRPPHLDPSTEVTGPTVHVVVPSFNASRLLQRCLAALERQTHPHRVIVVDNGSSDGSASRVRERFPNVVVIQNESNLGFAAGCNIGMQQALDADVDYVALLNQDAEPEPTWLAALVEVAQRDARIGAVASRILLATHRTLLNSAGLEVNADGKAWDRGFARVDAPQWQHPTEVAGASGCAMLLRAAALRTVGLFDPAYFAYYEDLDLSIRLWEAGYRIVYAPAAVVFHRSWHVFGGPSPLQATLLRSNRWRFVFKHLPLRRGRWRGTLIAELRSLLGRWRHGRLRAVANDCRVAARLLGGASSILRYRAAHRQRRTGGQHWQRFVLLAAVSPPRFTPRIDYRLLECEDDVWSARLLMGVNDTALGEGWYPLSTEEGSGLAFRWIGRSATCFLRVPHPGPRILQLHLKLPLGAGPGSRVHVRCNGNLLGALTLDAHRTPSWQTMHLPVDLERVTATVEIVAESPVLCEASRAVADFGVGINEVSLLADGSPLLRQPIHASANFADGQDSAVANLG